MGSLVKERFLWVDDLRKGLVLLLGDSVDPYFEVKQMTDPLTAVLTIALRQPLPKASRSWMRLYIRSWAKIGDCEVPRIEIENRRVSAELLFKYRHPRGKKTFDEIDRGAG